MFLGLIKMDFNIYLSKHSRNTFLFAQPRSLDGSPKVHYHSPSLKSIGSPKVRYHPPSLKSMSNAWYLTTTKYKQNHWFRLGGVGNNNEPPPSKTKHWFSGTSFYSILPSFTQNKSTDKSFNFFFFIHNNIRPSVVSLCIKTRGSRSISSCGQPCGCSSSIGHVGSLQLSCGTCGPFPVRETFCLQRSGHASLCASCWLRIASWGKGRDVWPCGKGPPWWSQRTCKWSPRPPSNCSSHADLHTCARHAPAISNILSHCTTES